jgi:hypothetical protein
MFSSIRSGMALSIFSACLGVPLLGGCPDPQGRFDQFVATRPDALVVVTPDAPPLNNIPDITGTFLLALHIVGIPTPVQTIATVTMTKMGDTATATLHIQFLNQSARMPIANATVDVPDVAIDDAGQFTASVAMLTIPADANPVLHQPAVAKDVKLGSSIQKATRFCGVVTGMITSPTPLDLTGSTYAAIAIQPGQTGGQLPDPEVSCSAPDAGM